MIAAARALDLRGLLDSVAALPTFGADAAALPASAMVPPLRPAPAEADPAEAPTPAAEPDAGAGDDTADTADYWIGIHDPVGDARRQLAGFSHLHDQVAGVAAPAPAPAAAAEVSATRPAVAFAGYRLKAVILVSVLAIGAAISVPGQRSPAVETATAVAPATVLAVAAEPATAVEQAAAEVPAVEQATAVEPAAVSAVAVETATVRAREAFVSHPVPRAQ